MYIFSLYSKSPLYFYKQMGEKARIIVDVKKIQHTDISNLKMFSGI